MRVLLSGYDSRGGVEPLAGLAARLREQGADVLVSVPPDDEFERRLTTVGATMVPFFQPVRPLTTERRRTPVDLPRRAAELIASQFDVVVEAAHGCDVVVATGVLPAAAGARSIAEKLGIPSVYATFQQLTLPSPDHPPLAYPGREFPPGTDNRVLWTEDGRTINDLFGDALNGNRASIALPPVADVRGYVVGERPWLATDPTLDPLRERVNLDVVQTGAWLVPDVRPLPPELVAFLDAGPPPVYAGFGSNPMRGAGDIARVAVGAIRALGRRAVIASGWADLAPPDDRHDCFAIGEVNQQALFARVAAVVHHGGAGTTTAAARAGAAQVVVAQGADQPYWASRVGDLGIGVAHDGPTPTVASLSTALRTALTPEIRARAIGVAGAIRTDGASVAAALLLDTVSRERRVSA